MRENDLTGFGFENAPDVLQNMVTEFTDVMRKCFPPVEWSCEDGDGDGDDGAEVLLLQEITNCT